MMAVDASTALPTELGVATAFATTQQWGELIQVTETYVVNCAAEVTIEPPPINNGPATVDEMMYALSRTCRFPPCDVTGLTLAYEVHAVSIDLFGFDARRPRIHRIPR